MSDDPFKDIDAAFDALDKRVALEQEAIAKSKAETMERQNRFGEIVRDVVRPTMQEVGERIKARGWHFKIAGDEKIADTTDVEFMFANTQDKLDGFRNEGASKLRFRLSVGSDKVTLSRTAVTRTGTASGPVGTASLDMLDADFIRKMLTKIIVDVIK